jgi:ATP-dependent DNA helicase UvrD/PcrA
VADALEAVGWRSEDPPSGGAVRERWEALAALVGVAEEFSKQLPVEGVTPLGAFSDELRRRAAAQHAPTVDGVTLSSLHSAKGLEWDAVFVVGVVEGTLPTTYARTPEQLEEERRLLYVGITRARQWLWLSYAGSRSPGGRNRQASRFLPALGRAGDEGRVASRRAAQGKRSEARRAITASCRICGTALIGGAARKLGRCADCPSDRDDELFERLREWRARTAASAGVPAYVVFTDATLIALAERQPSNDAGLVDIAGIGPRKLALYGEAVLALVGGASVDTVAARAADEQ